VIEVTAAEESDRLRIEVADEGVGMLPNPEAKGAGMGLAIIGALAERFLIESRERGVRITMLFARPSLAT
jgi:anti-sigma regulatory factor (Ser/Thr protein kinase)